MLGECHCLPGKGLRFQLPEEYQCYFDLVLGVYKRDGFLGREQVSWQPGRENARRHNELL